MQTIKTDMASIRADGDAKNLVESLPIAISAYNNRPHAGVFGTPQGVLENPNQDFRVLQDNARKGLLNRSSQLNKSKVLKQAGAFRAPLPGNIRSFEPCYGAVQLLGPTRKNDPNDMVRNKGEGTFLLKQIQPAVLGSGKAQGRLTEKTLPSSSDYRRGLLR